MSPTQSTAAPSTITQVAINNIPNVISLVIAALVYSAEFKPAAVYVVCAVLMLVVGLIQYTLHRLAKLRAWSFFVLTQSLLASFALVVFIQPRQTAPPPQPALATPEPVAEPVQPTNSAAAPAAPSKAPAPTGQTETTSSVLPSGYGTIAPSRALRLDQLPPPAINPESAFRVYKGDDSPGPKPARPLSTREPQPTAPQSKVGR